MNDIIFYKCAVTIICHSTCDLSFNANDLFTLPRGLVKPQIVSCFCLPLEMSETEHLPQVTVAAVKSLICIITLVFHTLHWNEEFPSILVFTAWTVVMGQELKQLTFKKINYPFTNDYQNNHNLHDQDAQNTNQSIWKETYQELYSLTRIFLVWIQNEFSRWLILRGQAHST